MKIKVCGLRDPQNFGEVQSLNPDYIGMIFYQKSPRAIGVDTDQDIYPISNKVNRVGVFVNEEITVVLEYVKKYKLAYIQLHGDETPSYINDLRTKVPSIKIIKAFQIKEEFKWTLLNEYNSGVDYFLFDTATKNYGGSGKKFNWKLLDNYNGSKPFFLSGGIGIDDIYAIKTLSHPMLYSIDINSKVELSPGLKDVDLTKKCINKLRHEQ